MKYLILLFLFTTLLLSSTRTKVLMGTFASISLEKNPQLIEEGFEIIKDVENSLSTYKPKSTVQTLNKDRYVKLDLYTYEVLKLCQKYYEKTDGYFNVAIGNISKQLYRFGENRTYIPHPKVLKSTLTSFRDIKFNSYEASLEAKIKLDFGGMGKGYAVDKVKEYYLKNNIKKAQISLSGDIACIGRCKVGVQNPFKENSSIFKINTKQNISSISTSGTYNRYVKNQKNTHLIDPYSKKPQVSFSSITLVSSLPNADIDAYATAASVMPFSKSIKFLDSLPLAYIIVTATKEILISKNYMQYFDLSISENVKYNQNRYIYYE
ncbi:FAD:protein FMN transferase [Sulfurimonas lithotrophica]|uniref:FAD:protein FMN transferase n=1 Tax=Sulfurimonas lithotrophica TaxID=2590022 RepID=A0A5P8P391_9BACT|nr:FAD:protein FMN transferase [Sulfurimonas lithotrophica]QFR50010.1 FAD:protein FMN transferase [Sulfurimonas lithotrophica]